MLLTPQLSRWLPLISPISDEGPSGLTGSSAPLLLPNAPSQALHNPFLPLLPLISARQDALTISSGQSSDLAAMQDLHARSLPLPFGPAFFLSALLKDTFYTLIAKFNGVLVGSVTAQLDTSKTIVYILTLCVDPNMRRRGIATQLLSSLAKILAVLRDPPLSAVLHVQITNASAVSLYTRLGFVVSTMKPQHYRGAQFGGSAAFEMVKRL